MNNDFNNDNIIFFFLVLYIFVAMGYKLCIPQDYNYPCLLDGYNLYEYYNIELLQNI